MKNKKYLMIVFFLLILSTKITARDFSDNLYLHLYNYQLYSGRMEDTTIVINKLKKEIVIKDLVDSLNTDSFGVYKFYDIRCGDTGINFLIMDKEYNEIYDISSYSALIERILDLNTCEKKKNLWIKAVLKLSDYCIDKDPGKMLMVNSYSKFEYILPSEKIRWHKGFIKNIKGYL